MTVESAAFISGLVASDPQGSDSISEGDDHLRVIKTAVQGTFPNGNAAINGIHTGDSQPTSRSAGQLWFDTTNNVLKIRNEADAGWITLNVSPVTDFKLLGSNTVGWILPTADGISGQYLTTNASGDLDWTSASGDELPQGGHSGKFLTTDGSTASWAASFSKAASCAFRATMSTHQDVLNVTSATIVYDTANSAPTSYDVGSDFNTSTYKFTAPETGYYYIEAASRWSGSGGSGAHSVDDDLHIVRTPDGGSPSTVITTSALSTIGGDYLQSYPVYQARGVLNLTALDTIHVTVYAEAGDFRITGGAVSSYFGGFQVA